MTTTSDHLAETDAKVLALLTRESMPLKPSEVAQWCAITPSVARSSLFRLRKAGRAHQNDIGFWSPLPKPTPIPGDE